MASLSAAISASDSKILRRCRMNRSSRLKAVAVRTRVGQRVVDGLSAVVAVAGTEPSADSTTSTMEKQQ